jgi:acyl-CoA thioesterase FadM
VARLGTTSLATRIVVMHSSRTVAEGKMRHVFVDPVTGSKRPIPLMVREALEPFVADSE